MSAATIARLTADQARQQLPDFADLYRDAYTKPPYDETEEHVTAFLDRFTTELDAPGLTLFAAMVDDRLGGFAHGLTFPPGRWWSGAGPPPDEISDQPTFAVIELIVDSRLRRRGIGQSLMAALLADCPEPFATLCANHDVPARTIYRRWGWRQIAQAGQTPVGPMDVLLLDLRRSVDSPGVPAGRSYDDQSEVRFPRHGLRQQAEGEAPRVWERLPLEEGSGS